MSEQVYRLELTERERAILGSVLTTIAERGERTHEPTAVNFSRELQAVASRLRALEPVGADGEGA